MQLQHALLLMQVSPSSCRWRSTVSATCWADLGPCTSCSNESLIWRVFRWLPDRLRLYFAYHFCFAAVLNWRAKMSRLKTLSGKQPDLTEKAEAREVIQPVKEKCAA